MAGHRSAIESSDALNALYGDPTEISYQRLMEAVKTPPVPRRVIIETPYAGDRDANVAFARQCMLDCLVRGESPYASHLLYTQCLDDNVPSERALGINAGLAWGLIADATIVYVDLGISAGMKVGIRHAEQHGRPVEYRQLRR